MRFYQADLRLENYWRSVILFGKNSVSYKFALAHALYDIRQPDNDLVALEALAAPFARHRGIVGERVKAWRRVVSVF